MKHTITIPPDWSHLAGLQKFLSARFVGDSFEFTPDVTVTMPECVQSWTPPEFVIRNSATGAPCNYPVFDEINNAINEFLKTCC